ncbi:MAG: hypothetical protein JWN46_3515 [Acidimicrobiales bacterium]|nr:hypothetical protein [Acidimicrobiales bacterium]
MSFDPRVRAARLAIIVLLAASGCGPATHKSAEPPTSTPASAPASASHDDTVVPSAPPPAAAAASAAAAAAAAAAAPRGSRTFAELWRSSTKLVIGDVRWVQDIPTTPGQAPQTKATLRVDRVLASKPDHGPRIGEGSLLAIRQVSQPGAPISGDADTVRWGHRYVLFVHPLEVHPGQPSTEWTTTARDGAYSADVHDQLTRLDAASPLPAAIDVPSLVAQATGR